MCTVIEKEMIIIHGFVVHTATKHIAMVPPYTPVNSLGSNTKVAWKLPLYTHDTRKFVLTKSTVLHYWFQEKKNIQYKRKYYLTIMCTKIIICESTGIHMYF